MAPGLLPGCQPGCCRTKVSRRSLSKPAMTLYRLRDFFQLPVGDDVFQTVETVRRSLLDHLHHHLRAEPAVALNDRRRRGKAGLLVARNASGPAPFSRRASASDSASRIACEAPFEPIGYIGWAASPSSVTRPKRPARQRIAVDHRVLVGLLGRAAISAGHVEPVEAPVGERAAANSLVSPRRFQSSRRRRWSGLQLALGDPVDQRARRVRRLGRRSGRRRTSGLRGPAMIIERPVEERGGLGHAAPQHRRRSTRRALVRVELAPQRRVDAVGADQHVAPVPGDDRAAARGRRTWPLTSSPSSRSRPGGGRRERLASPGAVWRSPAGSSATRPGGPNTAASVAGRQAARLAPDRRPNLVK